MVELYEVTPKAHTSETVVVASLTELLQNLTKHGNQNDKIKSIVDSDKAISFQGGSNE